MEIQVKDLVSAANAPVQESAGDGALTTGSRKSGQDRSSRRTNEKTGVGVVVQGGLGQGPDRI